MPNFKKIVRAVFWENVLWTDRQPDTQPDKSDFIGLFPVNRRPNMAIKTIIEEQFVFLNFE